jgi:hypothetical protein
VSPQKREVLMILQEAGAVLVRQRKHKIFRFQDGLIWVLPKTPSDTRAWKNNLAGLRRRLGMRKVDIACPEQNSNRNTIQAQMRPEEGVL